MISVLPLPSSFDGEKKIVLNQTETGTGEPRIVRDIQMHTHRTPDVDKSDDVLLHNVP